MKIFLALICFLAMMVHAFFGYFLYVRGESVFEPDNMVVAVQKKAESSGSKFDIFKKKSSHIEDPQVKAQAQNAAFYEKPNDGLIKVEDNQKEGAPAQASDTASTTNAAASDEKPAEAVSSDAPAAASEPVKETPTAPAKEEYLPFNTGWSGFLQVENAIITTMLFFLGFAVCCVKGRGPASRWVFGFNLIFWGSLAAAIWFFIPQNTPLTIFNIKFGFPQWYLVIGLCGLAALLSFLLFVNAFRRPVEAIKKSAEEPKPVVTPAAPAPTEKKHNRFGFGGEDKEPKLTQPDPETILSDKKPE